MVRGSKPRFSVGIYGDWGTGKTTLMRMIKKKLENEQNKIIVSWDALEKDTVELRRFLASNYDVDWIKNTENEWRKTSPDIMEISDRSNTAIDSYPTKPSKSRKFSFRRTEPDFPNSSKITVNNVVFQ